MSSIPSPIGQADPTAVEITTSTPINLAIGQTSTLSWIFLDANLDTILDLVRVMTLSSSAATVASVDSVGVVTGNGAGTATITVASPADNLSDTAMVLVTSPQSPPSSITYSPSVVQGVAGATTLVSALVLDSTNTSLTGLTVTWSSSSAAAFTVGSDNTALDPTHRATLTFVGASSSTVTLTATESSMAITASIPVTVAAAGSGAQPIWETDFNYSSTTSFIADRAKRANWATGANWSITEDTLATTSIGTWPVNSFTTEPPSGYITLVNDACPGSVTGKCMQFSYPVVGNTIKAHRRSPIMPSNGQFKEMWVQWYEKHSTIADGVPAFDTDSDPARLYKAGSPDWKHMLVSVSGQAPGDPDSASRGGFEIGNQGGRLCNVYPIVSQTNPSYQISQPVWQGGSNQVWFNGMKLGGWHKFQMYLKVSTSYTLTSGTADGAAVGFFDGQYVLGATGVVVKRTWYLYPRWGDTYNLGIDANHVGMWVRFAGLKVWAGQGNGQGSPLWGYTALGVAVP